jgi:type IV pilus assembly protein PilB
VFETLPVDDRLQELIVGGADHPQLKREAVRRGMKTLRQAALRKLAEGITTFEEVVRVTTG